MKITIENYDRTGFHPDTVKESREK